MPYNKELDRRIKRIVSRWIGTADKKMFGGVCHLLDGNMFCGGHKDFLILRLGEKQAREALNQTHTRPFDITGKPMKGWIMVAGDRCKSDRDLKVWLDQAKGFVKTLPKK
jgi:hypothetical protein